MKKTILAIAAILLMASGASAQEESPHILFKGIPVTGLEEDFAKQLSEKQYTYSKGLLTGPFAGYEVTLRTRKTEVSGVLYKVTALLLPSGWKQAKTNYIIFKTNMSLKYGQPSAVTEKFTGAYHDGDGYELKALAEDACRYRSEWSTPLGKITVEITGMNKMAAVAISYEDSANSRLNVQEKTNLFLEDL